MAASLGAFTKHIGAGVGRMSQVIMARGQGSWVWSESGEKYLDFTSGIGVTSTGHCHPAVVKAVQEQAAKMVHAQVGVGFGASNLNLVKDLLPLMPRGLDTFVFLNSGSEAVENAVKLARQATGKPNVIVFKGSYHGRTMGAMAMTTSKFGPLMPGVFVTPFPYCINCPSYSKAASCCNSPIDELRLLLKTQTTPSETCAIIIEPVLGEGGYVPMPPNFLKQLKAVCEEGKMLLIVDEVQTGFGRTGKMFACDGHYNTVPDILVMAKGIASGYPMSAIVSRKELMDRQPAGSMGGTYTANPVCSAAASATLRVLQEEGLVGNAHVRGQQLMAGLRALQSSGKYPIRDVRGLGLMIGLEFERAQPAGTANKVSAACLANNMMLLTTSVYETVRFIPPLTVSVEEVDMSLDIFKRSLDTVFGRK